MPLISSDYIPENPLKRWKHRLLKDKKVLDIGSYGKRLTPFTTTLDIINYKDVDVVADACKKIPFPDNTFDTVWCEAVLEHMHNPTKAVLEMHRVLKPNGLIFVVVPFIHKYHDYPNDYGRWTTNGLEILFKDFATLEIGVYRGATSALLSFITEYFTLFTFTDNKTINWLVKACFMTLLFPWKYLDKLLIKNQRSHELACALYYIGVKNG